MGMFSSSGAADAASQQAERERQIAKGWGTLGQTEYGWFSPFMQAGTQSLSGAMQLMANPINSQVALDDYYGSSQYAAQEQEAEYAAQSAAEATGSLGSTATGNALASQSVKLGQGYLDSLNKQRQGALNALTGVSKMGLNATTSMSNIATRDAQGASSSMERAASLEGQAAMAEASGRQGMLSKGMGAAMQDFGYMAAL